MIRVQHIDHVALTVRDIRRSIDWYAETLGLEHRSIVEWGEYPQMVCAGETCVALFPAESGREDASQPAITMTHLAFRVDRASFDKAEAEFKEQGTEYRYADHDVAHSLYISDPDGHKIELTTYEV